MRVRFTWRERLAAWYLDIYDLDDVPIILGRRVTEQWAPLAGHALGDELDRDVLLVVQGPSPYAREDLGDRLMVLLVPRADLPASPATAYPLTVEVT